MIELAVREFDEFFPITCVLELAQMGRGVQHWRNHRTLALQVLSSLISSFTTLRNEFVVVDEKNAFTHYKSPDNRECTRLYATVRSKESSNESLDELGSSSDLITVNGHP